jgi:hypothetical protein
MDAANLDRESVRHSVNAWAGDSFRLWAARGLTPGEQVNLSLEDENGDGIFTICGVKPPQLARLHEIIGKHLGSSWAPQAEEPAPDREAG